MKLRKIEKINLLIVIASIVFAVIIYPKMPETVASHWNSLGQVDGYMNRFWGSFMLPFVLSVIWLLFVIVPRIDPKKNNIEKFRDQFDGFILLFSLLFFYLYTLTIYWNLTNKFDFSSYIIPAFSILFFYIGYMISEAKQNYSIGIRTPWTLDSKEVWDKTHKLGGLLYKIAAIVTLTGTFFPNIAYIIFLTTILATSLFLIFYSYYTYLQ